MPATRKPAEGNTPMKPQSQITDPARDVWRYGRHTLEKLFTPKTVAVIGATETPGSVGRTLLWNLVSNPFGGVVFPVNLKRSSVLGIKAYPTIKDVPEPVDLAVIVTPAGAVPVRRHRPDVGRGRPHAASARVRRRLDGVSAESVGVAGLAVMSAPAGQWRDRVR